MEITTSINMDSYGLNSHTMASGSSLKVSSLMHVIGLLHQCEWKNSPEVYLLLIVLSLWLYFALW
jgi:hypothetical protein